MFLDRNWSTIVQNKRGITHVGVLGLISFGPSQSKHLANPEAKLRRSDSASLGIMQDGPDIVEHGLRNECFESFLRCQVAQIAGFHALVLCVSWESRLVVGMGG